MSKKSFLLHIDSLNILDEMTDEQAGKLIKTIHIFQKKEELPELDFGLKMAITPFINQFKRDGVNYEKTVERNRINGSLGGRPRKPSGLLDNPNKPSGFFNNPDKPKKADKDKDKDSVNEEGKKNKQKKINSPPLLDEVKIYVCEINQKYSKNMDAEYFVDKVSASKEGWSAVKCWKSKARNYCRKGWAELDQKKAAYNRADRTEEILDAVFSNSEKKEMKVVSENEIFN